MHTVVVVYAEFKLYTEGLEKFLVSLALVLEHFLKLGFYLFLNRFGYQL